ncbi:TonB family protein [Novilysobacter defluvii]|nr:TonB family protein [Lysobacter defluvii]
MSNTDARVRRGAPGTPTGTFARLALAAALGLALGACGGSDGPQEQATDGETGDPVATADGVGAVGTGGAAPPAAGTAAPDDAAAAMDIEELRKAAREAYAGNRLYAPAGDNAVEYYLALRERRPEDPSAGSALTDLLPMTVIATEQSLVREDFEEGKRLIALLERTDASHPALDRLRRSAERGERELAARLAREQVTAEEQAQRRAELERQRQADQQREQEEAARRLAEQQAAEEEAARQAAAEQAGREEAERLAAERRREAARQQSQAAVATAADLRPLSIPAPQYPREALRAGRAGEVEVELTVGIDGSVTAARVIRADPARVFDRAALAAVEQWRFQPIASPVTARRTIAFNPDP